MEKQTTTSVKKSPTTVKKTRTRKVPTDKTLVSTAIVSVSKEPLVEPLVDGLENITDTNNDNDNDTNIDIDTNENINDLDKLEEVDIDRVEKIEKIENTQKKLDMTFNINERFEFLEKLTKMVAKKKTESLIVTGEGGLGKTFTVTKTVKKHLKNRNVKVIKGYSTPRGLYNSLYDYNGKLFIFDDCDSILENSTSLNILKSALDSYDKREISWSSQMRAGDEYPQSFVFTGSIIFISNKKREKLNQAVISRSMLVDLSMNTDEKIERMRSVLSHVEPKISNQAKVEALDLIETYKNDIKDLNFRTLVKVSKIRDSFPKKWESLAKYSMFEGESL